MPCFEFDSKLPNGSHGTLIDHFYFVYCFCFKERVAVAQSDDGHAKLVKPRVTKAKTPDTCLF